MKQLSTAAILMLGAMGVTCWADPMDPDPLHGYCDNGAQCIDNGTNSPTSLNPPPNFGFTVDPGPATGSTLLIDVLEPSNGLNDAPVQITGTYSGTAQLFSGTPWTSGDLDAYLGISASPANPIGAFLFPGVPGFFVYQLSISGSITLQGASNPNVNPLENITGTIPQGTYIVGFLNEGTAGYVATANSSAILETSAPTTTPEPSSIALVGLGTLGMVALLRRKRQGRLTS